MTKSRAKAHLVKLEALRVAMETPERLTVDPLGAVPRSESPLRQELVAYIAAGLAFGNVSAIGRSVANVVSCLDHLDALTTGHRWVRAADLRALIMRLKQLQAEYGSLGQAFGAGYIPGDMRTSLSAFSDKLRHGLEATRGIVSMTSNARDGSACKRLNLFMRWMVRPDGHDLGLWSEVSAADLIAPLDVHVVRFAQQFGGIQRTTVNWRMAEEVTSFYREIVPDDPLRYDFAISHFGMVHGWEPSALADTIGTL